MKINHIIQEAGTGLEIDRSIPGRTIARISGDLAYRTGSPTDKRLPDQHDDYTPWSGKVGASTRDDEEDTFDIDYTGDDGELKEFVTPQATAQDPGLEREKDVDVIFFGLMPQDFTARTAWKALEDVLPREYPAGSERAQNKIAEVSKNNGAVVTTKPLSIAQKLVKEFQARGIKCRIVQSGLDEAVEDYAGTYSPEAIAIGKKFCDQYNITHDTDVQLAVELIDAYLDEFKWRNVPVDLNVIKSKVAKDFRNVYRGMGPGPSFRKKFQEQDMAEGAAGLPDPNNFDSDNDYYDARDAYAKPQDNDSDYENWAVDDANESKEKIGNMDADAFDAALSRMKKLAGAGPLRTVYDPNKRVYKNVPHAVQPAQQPKKAR